MADEQDKAAAPQPAPTNGMPRHKSQPGDEQRRIQDALEDDDVREALKERHAHKAKCG
jgi:hypothetical protein